MKWLDRLLNRAPAAKTGKRLYAGAKGGRLMFSAPSSSANAELYTSLPVLRNRSRALIRDNVYATRAKQIIVDNVIGTGVGLQAQVINQRGRLLDDINDSIEHAHAGWMSADGCHTGGTLHFSDFERTAMGEVFEAGEVLIRLHRIPFGESKIPLALELIEAERIADDFEIKAPEGASVTMGIEHDSFGRPLAYYIHARHPSELHLGPSRKVRDEITRVPADQIIHLKLTDRWPQVRGVPWLHAAINQLNQLGEFHDSALVAARIGASKVGFFENPEGDMGIADGQEADGTPNMTVEAGEFTQLPPGYKFQSWDPTYPNETFDPFTRAFLRGIAAGVPGLYYSGLSQDYSQANYSSERSATLDTRGTWRAIQHWWIRSFRQPLHRQWLQAAVMARAVNIDVQAYALDRAKFEAVKFKPRGWGWVDPTKEVAAYKEAEKAGYITKTDIIAATAGGLDLEDVLKTRRHELDMMEAMDLTSDTTQSERPPEGTPPNPDDDQDEDAPPARVFAFKRDYE